MMKYSIILFLIFSGLLISCDESNEVDGKDCIGGSGTTIEENRPVDDFIGIQACIAGNLYNRAWKCRSNCHR